MIDEDRTLQLYGYTSDELTSGSHKRVVVVCEECGKYATSENRQVKELCKACGMTGDRNHFYGKYHTPQSRQKMRDHSSRIHGKDHHLYGHHLPEKTLQKLRICGMQRTGENAANWQGGKVLVVCDYCGSVIKRFHCCVYPHNFCGDECWKGYQLSDAGKIMYSASQQGVQIDDWKEFAVRDPRNYVQHESLCMRMNERFPASHAHHITKSVVIYIPAELHHHISHNIKTGANMGEMNMLAIQYETGWW